MVLSILPLLRRMKDLQWLRAFMRGVASAVIGALGVSVVQMAPHAAPELYLVPARSHRHDRSVFEARPVALDGGRRGARISVLAQDLGLRADVGAIDPASPAAGPRRVARSPEAPVRETEYRTDIDLAQHIGVFAYAVRGPYKKSASQMIGSDSASISSNCIV